MLRVCGYEFCLILFCLYICVCLYLQIQGPLRECRSIRPGASGLPYYCTPLVYVPAVIGLLAVLQHNKPKTKKPEGIPDVLGALAVLRQNIYNKKGGGASELDGHPLWGRGFVLVPGYITHLARVWANNREIMLFIGKPKGRSMMISNNNSVS